jgi:hypothetical protein
MKYIKHLLFFFSFLILGILNAQNNYSYESSLNLEKKKNNSGNHFFMETDFVYTSYPGLGNKFDNDFKQFLTDNTKRPVKGSIASFGISYRLGVSLSGLEISTYQMNSYPIYTKPDEEPSKTFSYVLDASFRGLTLSKRFVKEETIEGFKTVFLVGMGYREAKYQMAYFGYNEPGLPIVNIHPGWYAFSEKYTYLIPSISILTGKKIMAGMEFSFSLPLQTGAWNYQNFPKFGFNHLGWGLLKVRYNII